MKYVLCAVLTIVACGDESPSSEACITTRDCADGRMCTNGRCLLNGRDAAGVDAPDVGVEDARVQDIVSDVQDIALSDAAPDAGPCGGGRCGWRLRGTTWSSFALEGSFAPMLPVRAALDFDTHDVAYLLTDTTYHVFRPSDQSFTSAGTRDDLMPEASGVLVVSATAAPSGNPLFQVVVTAADLANLYSFDPATRAFAYVDRVTEFGEDWSGPRAPARNTIQAAWRTSHNDRAWVDDSETCVVVGSYAGFIADGSVYPRDFGDCRVFLDVVPFAEFPPFALRGAPASTQLGAAFFHEDELWVFDE